MPLRHRLQLLPSWLSRFSPVHKAKGSVVALAHQFITGFRRDAGTKNSKSLQDSNEIMTEL
jgi:hypothetical protein